MGEEDRGGAYKSAPVQIRKTDQGMYMDIQGRNTTTTNRKEEEKGTQEWDHRELEKKKRQEGFRHPSILNGMKGL